MKTLLNQAQSASLTMSVDLGVVNVELARLVSGTVDRMLLSGCGLNGPIRGMHQNASFSTIVVCMLRWHVLSLVWQCFLNSCVKVCLLTAHELS